jgi:hypothetical protein
VEEKGRKRRDRIRRRRMAGGEEEEMGTWGVYVE